MEHILNLEQVKKYYGGNSGNITKADAELENKIKEDMQHQLVKVDENGEINDESYRVNVRGAEIEQQKAMVSVCGIDIRVLDDELAEALKKLPERKRNTLLMYYFLEMTESEIANLQKITQSGVFRNRHHALETMKKILKEKQ